MVNRTLLFLGACALGATAAPASAAPARTAAPTFQELMDPALFPEPQRGMRVDSAEMDGRSLRVTTTGARFRVNLARGEIACEQRIGHERPLARLRLGKPLSGGQFTHRGPGFARAAFERPRVTIRINGDSLLMLHAHEPLEVLVERTIEPAWHASFGANHLLADEWGGFGLYCSERSLEDSFDAYGAATARYSVPADAVLWLGACPPKPYDWDRSLRDNVVWHWSNQLGYPSDETLRAWKEHGNTVLLQSEVMLWKDWNLDFVPRLGAEEFARVRRTLHDQEMRFIVYTSPYYFLKGTALEPRALNSFEGFTGWPPGTPTGENMELFMAAIERVMKEYRPDGLYFDGQYVSNPAALYALARRTRALLGEEGILEWHSTAALGNTGCFLPQADAYVDFVLRGEGRQGRYTDFDYLRFFVSGYNLHNSIGVLCNNGPVKVPPELARDVLRANARLHTLAGWLSDAATMRTLQGEYRARLNPELRRTVDAQVDERQAGIGARTAARREEAAALAREPVWGDPRLQVAFPLPPGTASRVSAANADPFRTEAGVLQVRAHAHTHAYLAEPLQGKARGLVVRLRQGTDGGQSWGPAAAIRFADGALVRVGTRSDGKLQADVLGQQLYGGAHDPSRWVRLRVRWLDRLGVVERSDDGKAFTPVWTFEHGGALGADAAELLLGKVPYNGEPKDHAEAGPPGECEIAEVRVY